VVARFEAERQALALMDHPNIAQIHDGGTTESGRPYFVMELVRGVPITEFCDQRRLTTRQRLELFVTVCQAVQHAHQKGIIRRDLKPSNVLVTLHDTVAVPKVIDFGIAKAASQPLTERTLFTGFGQMIGTPLYMSPEQAEMNGQLARTLGVTPHWIYDRIHNGATQVALDPTRNLYLFPDEPKTITLFQQLRAGKVQRLRI
jgi:serine/threonine-protein kinase